MPTPDASSNLIRAVRRPRAVDFAQLAELLDICELPPEGIDDDRCDAFIAELDGRIVGSAAIEWWDSDPLLRSVAVHPEYRGRSVGHAVVEAALGFAKARGAESVHLLTTSAENYFPAFGFEVVERSKAPAGIQKSDQFREFCPSTATLMCRRFG